MEISNKVQSIVNYNRDSDFVSELKNADLEQDELNALLCIVCKAGNAYYARAVLERGADDYDGALISTCEGKCNECKCENRFETRESIIDILCEYTTFEPDTLDTALICACKSGNSIAMCNLIRLGATEYTFGFVTLLENDNEDSIDRMYAAIDDYGYRFNLTSALRIACARQYLKAIEKLVDRGADDFDGLSCLLTPYSKSVIKNGFGKFSEHLRMLENSRY